MIIRMKLENIPSSLPKGLQYGIKSLKTYVINPQKPFVIYTLISEPVSITQKATTNKDTKKDFHLANLDGLMIK